MGGKGGGGDGGAAAAAAAEAARKARIAGNIDAVKRQFFAPETLREVPDASTVPDPIFGQRTVPKSFYQDQYDDVGQTRYVPEQFVINQAEIDQAQKAIDDANEFNANRPLTGNPTEARLASFQDIEDRVRQRFLPDFEQDIKDAKRELGFALSRRSLRGSSAQADAEERLQDRIGEGRREIDQRVAGARSEKEAFDQQLLNNLISQAQSDISRSSLLGGVGSSFLANTNRAITGANQQAFGNIFQDVGSLFKEINDQRAIQQGLSNAALFANQLRQDPTNLFSSQKGTSGNITDFS